MRDVHKGLEIAIDNISLFLKSQLDGTAVNRVHKAAQEWLERPWGTRCICFAVNTGRKAVYFVHYLRYRCLSIISSFYLRRQGLWIRKHFWIDSLFADASNPSATSLAWTTTLYVMPPPHIPFHSPVIACAALHSSTRCRDNSPLLPQPVLAATAWKSTVCIEGFVLRLMLDIQFWSTFTSLVPDVTAGKQRCIITETTAALWVTCST